jgi:ketosteroid isomerase-like protein
MLPGMTINEIAAQLVALTSQGKFREAIDTLYADDASSLEPMAFGDMPRETHSKAAILGKSDWWQSMHEVHEMTVDGPFVSPEYFAVVFGIDVTNKQSGMRMKGREVALYTVADGKITSDQFLGFVPAS